MTDKSLDQQVEDYIRQHDPNAARYDALRQELSEASELAKKTGRSITKTFNKKLFLEAIPAARTDPRFFFDSRGSDTVIIDFKPMERILVGELRKLCVGSSNTQLALEKLKSVEGLVEGQTVAIPKQTIIDLSSKTKSTMPENPQIVLPNTTQDPPKEEKPKTEPKD